VDEQNNTIHWLVVAAFAFFGGLVHNILVPEQRGAAGFLAAALVGTFCGVIGGVAAYEFKASPGVQWICSGGTGVFGYVILRSVFGWLRRESVGRTEFQIFGGNNQVGTNVIGREEKKTQ